MPSPDTPDPGADERRALESLLRWYVAMGVDCPVDEEAHDRFAVAVPQSSPAARPSSVDPARSFEAPPRPEATPAGADALIEHARMVAASADSIEALRDAWDGFEGCALSKTAARMIFAGGNPRAKIIVLGAAPGSDDERQGEAFAGPTGKLLDGMLRSIGLSRESVYLVNVIPWRPPGNRPPTPLESALCLPFTRRHIALVDPAFILCLGERAAQLILETKEPMTKLRGRWQSYPGDLASVKLTVTFSLDYLLSQPLQKKRAWLDLLTFRDVANPGV